jgi:hypothetical protein
MINIPARRDMRTATAHNEADAGGIGSRELILISGRSYFAGWLA